MGNPNGQMQIVQVNGKSSLIFLSQSGVNLVCNSILCPLEPN